MSARNYAAKLRLESEAISKLLFRLFKLFYVVLHFYVRLDLLLCKVILNYVRVYSVNKYIQI